MIDPPRIANLLSAGQHNLNYFVRKREIKCVKCVNPLRHLHKCYPMWTLHLHDQSSHMWEECHLFSWWAVVVFEDRWRCTHEDVWRCNINLWQHPRTWELCSHI